MKILQINVVYKNGSTGKIVDDISSYLKENGVESYVIYGRGEKAAEENVFKVSSESFSKIRNITSKVFGSHFGRAWIPTMRAVAIIKKTNPDVVHLHCLNGYFINVYKLLHYLKTNGIKTILTLHAEIMHTGGCGHSFECEKWETGCGHCPNKSRNNGTFSFGRDDSARAWKRMKKSFDGFNNLTIASVSGWLSSRAERSPILADKRHVVVHNGINTQVFRMYNESEVDDKIKKTFSRRPVVFHVTPSFESEIKGGRYLVEIAKKMPTTNFVVAGNYDSSINYPDNIEFLGKINNQKILAQCYSSSDLTVLTSEKETFSMIVAESLCCGTPIVGFKAGAPETIAIKEFSEFVDFPNVEMLQETIYKWLAMDLDRIEICNQGQNKFDSKQMANKYLKLYESDK